MNWYPSVLLLFEGIMPLRLERTSVTLGWSSVVFALCLLIVHRNSCANDLKLCHLDLSFYTSIQDYRPFIFTLWDSKLFPLQTEEARPRVWVPRARSRNEAAAAGALGQLGPGHRGRVLQQEAAAAPLQEAVLHRGQGEAATAASLLRLRRLRLWLR